MENSILQLLWVVLPAIIVATIAFYFFNMHTRNEEQRRKYLLHKENRKHAFPIRLQAYERMTLFLERIAPGNLLIRTKPYNESKDDYATLLIRTIEQEYEHNLAQQIYVSEECWNVIRASKNATITNLRKMAAKEEVKDAADLRQQVLASLMEQEPASNTGISFIKKEVSGLW